MEMVCYDAHLGCLNWSDDLKSATPRMLPMCHPIVLLYGVVVLRTTVFRFIAYCPAYLDSCLTRSTLRTRAPAKAYLHSHVKNMSIQPSGLTMTSILSFGSLNSQNQLWRVTSNVTMKRAHSPLLQRLITARGPKFGRTKPLSWAPYYGMVNFTST
jgi:hypothetical protein